MWTANAGTGTGTSKAYVYLYLPELREQLADSAYQSSIEAMSAIPAFAAEFASGRRKYPSVYLDTLSNADVALMTAAIGQLAHPRTTGASSVH